eukprot:6059855-Prymnesium_polylepis.1
MASSVVGVCCAASSADAPAPIPNAAVPVGCKCSVPRTACRRPQHDSSEGCRLFGRCMRRCG